MTVLALKLSRRANAVSSLHGHVSRSMWTGLWPGRAEEEVPIGHITNGVHVPTWLAPQMRQLYDRHLGPDWPQRTGEPGSGKRSRTSTTASFGKRTSLKYRLFDFVRRRAVRQAERRGETEEVVDRCRRVLSLDALTIGFARRFATYKRANLIFHDLERIAAL